MGLGDLQNIRGLPLAQGFTLEIGISRLLGGYLKELYL